MTEDEEGPSQGDVSASTPSGASTLQVVSVVIPARAWGHDIERTLRSLAVQDLPAGVTVEIVVALADVADADPPEGIVVVPNPDGWIPSGLNYAVAASSGDVVVRIDSRCDVPRSHISRVLAGLTDESVGCVGGAALVLDRGLFGSTYAVAFNSVLLGPSPYRYRRRSGPADTAYLGAWRRADLDALGGFDPRLMRNQDNELADRVRDAGKVVFFDADIVVGYYNGRGLVDSLAHHHEFGLWRMVQRGHGQRALTPRHMGALGAVGAIGVASVVALRSPAWRHRCLTAGSAAYVAAGVAATTSALRLRRSRPDIVGPALHPAAPLLAPALAVAINGAWSAGLVRGAWRTWHAC